MCAKLDQASARRLRRFGRSEHVRPYHWTLAFFPHMIPFVVHVKMASSALMIYCRRDCMPRARKRWTADILDNFSYLSALERVLGAFTHSPPIPARGSPCPRPTQIPI